MVATIIELLISKIVISPKAQPKAQESISEALSVLAYGAQKLNEAVLAPILREVDAICETFPSMERRDALDFVLAGYGHRILEQHFEENPDADRDAFFTRLDERWGEQ